MTFIFGHLMGGWLFGRLIEIASKRKFSHYEWMLVMLGSLLPDIDFALDWFFGFSVHRTFTHSLIFMAAFSLIAPIAISAIASLFSSYKANLLCLCISRIRLLIIGLSLALGIFSHFILDMSFGQPGIPLFWPVDYGIWFFGIKKFAINALLEGTTERLITLIKFLMAEMFIAAVWFSWLMLTGKINFSRK